jgi:hypothetical protein
MKELLESVKKLKEAAKAEVREQQQMQLAARSSATASPPATA